jgi:uncharacterized repeat protein (TIGR01451 family)
MTGFLGGSFGTRRNGRVAQRLALSMLGVLVMSAGWLHPAAAQGALTYTFDPTEGPPGTEIFYSGSGCPTSDTGSDGNFVVNTTGSPRTNPTDIFVSDADGNFGGSLIIPADTEPGTYETHVICFSTTELVQDGTFTVTGPLSGADLSLSKVADKDVVGQGEQLIYTVSVENLGPLDATEVTLTDALPPGAVYVSDTSGCAYDGPSHTLTCAIGDMIFGDFFSVDIVVTAPDADGLITNTAAVTSGTEDPDPSNDSASVETTVASGADLSVSKFADKGPVSQGEQLTYTISVNNAGPLNATGVTLTDALPAGAVYVSDTSDLCVYDEPSHAVTCTIGDMPNGGLFSVDILVTAPNVDGVITNTADVISGTEDPDLSNNTATEETTVASGADLQVTKFGDEDVVGKGDQLTYTVWVDNLGPLAATGVTLTDALPAGAVYVSDTSDLCIYDEPSHTVTCTIGDMPSGDFFSVNIVVTAPNVGGLITNTADVASETDDPDPSNNSDTVETTVVSGADLSVSKFAEPDPVAVGEQLTYTVDVYNDGPEDATNVVLTDTLPPGVTNPSAAPSQGACDEPAGTVTCNLGTIPAFDSAEILITVTAPSEAGTITNNASVSSDVEDPDTTNNETSVETEVGRGADLSVFKFDDIDPADPGSDITYTILTENDGPVTASAVTLTDTLPDGVSVVSITTTHGSCSESPGTVTCALGDLPAFDAAQIDIVVTAPATDAILVNEASVSSTTEDPDPSDNSDSEGTVVGNPPTADLALFKIGDQYAAVGDPYSYFLFVESFGPEDAQGVTVTDTLPTGVTFESATTDQGTCSEAGGTVTCELGTVPADGFVDIEIVVTPNQVGTITNTAEIAAQSPGDPSPEDNADSTTTQVLEEGATDLAVFKDGRFFGAVGTPYTYSIFVENFGPSATTGVTVTDTLPPGMTFVSAQSSQGSCTETGGTVTCLVGAMPVDDVVDITIELMPTAEGAVTNRASVTGDGADPDGENNSSTADSEILPAGSADVLVSKFGRRYAAVGTPYTYSIVVDNIGPADATGVTATDTLPAGMTFISASPSQGSCTESSGTVTCDIGAVQVDDFVEVEIVAMPSAEGIISNTATIDADGPDPDPDSNSSTFDVEVLPVGSADVSLFKSGDRYAAVGSPYEFSIAVFNDGPAEATGVTVTDTLPTDTTFVSATASQGTCAESGGTVTCELGSVAPDDSAFVDIVVTPSAEGPVTNTAALTADGQDPDATNDTDTFEAEVLPAGSADLSVFKFGDDLAATDSPYTYTVFVDNNGPADAADVSVVDTLPGTVTFESADPSTGTCTESSGTVTCNLGTLASGDFATVDIVVTPTAEGTVVNTVEVSGAGSDPEPANDSDSISTTVGPPAADIVVFKFGDDVAATGSPYTYTVFVDNFGPSTATGVSMTDTLPSGMTFESADPSQGTCSESAGTVTCALGTIAADDFAIVDIVVTPTTEGSITNTASASAASPGDPEPGNNADSFRVDVGPPSADLEVFQSGNSLAALGSPYTINVFVHNQGPSASEVTLSDTLPANAEFVAAVPDQGTCGAPVGGVLSCNLGSVPARTLVRIGIVVEPTSGTTLSNTAQATGSVPDPDEADNSATLETPIVPAGTADLFVTKSDSSDPASTGETLRYTLGVDNAGPATASGVTVTDTLPAVSTFVSATPSQGTCSEAGGTVTCALGNLAPFAQASVGIEVTAPATPQELTNTASVSSSSDDPDTTNNEDTETTQVVEDVTDSSVAETSTGTVVVEDGEVTVTMFRGDRSDITITTHAECPDGSTPSSVTLTLGTKSYLMAETPPGSKDFTATIPAADVQSGELLVTAVCDGTPITNDIGQIVLYDPSGVVKDAATNALVEGATVSLYQVPGWRARTGPEENSLPNTCESNLSKPDGAAWSQPAPVGEGILANPDSGLIDPAVNPQTTNSAGRYGWDVAAGCWFVIIQAPGYESVTSPVVGVPPEVTDLDLGLSGISVALTRSAEKRVFGQSVTLNGTISATPACKADRSVQIQRDVLGGAVTFENYLAPLTSSSTGAFTATFKPDRSADYRAVAAGTDDCGESVSRLARVLVAVKVTLKASKAKVPAGRTVTFTATVAPCTEGHPGDKVDLYRGTRKIANKALSSTCKATFKIKITKKATFQAKWKKQDDDHEAGASNKVTIRAI